MQQKMPIEIAVDVMAMFGIWRDHALNPEDEQKLNEILDKILYSKNTQSVSEYIDYFYKKYV